MPSPLPPRISVVIPCYNAARYIAATLESVLAQDWADLEIIVVDDGSKDQSASIVQSRFPRVRLIQQANQGVAAARNHGIKVSTGEWIAFVDADDLWLPGKLQAQWAMMQANPSARLGYTAWQTWASFDATPSASLLADLSQRAENASAWEGPSGWIYPELLLDCEVWTSTVLVQRSLIEEIGAFDPDLRLGEDYDLWLRASRQTPILRVNRPTALYRQHPHSITQTAPLRNYQGEVIERALSKWGYTSPDGRRADTHKVNRTLAKSWCNFGNAQLNSGNFSLARHGAKMAIRADWLHTSGWKILAKSFLLKMKRVAA